jgi:hypothetical protein
LKKFEHVSTEYWIPDPALPPSHIVKCHGGEDDGCSDGEENALLAKLVLALTEVAFAADYMVISEPLLAKVDEICKGFWDAHFSYIIKYFP